MLGENIVGTKLEKSLVQMLGTYFQGQQVISVHPSFNWAQVKMQF